MLTPQKGREGTAQAMAKQTNINNHKKKVLPVVVSSTGEDIQLSLLSRKSEDVKGSTTSDFYRRKIEDWTPCFSEC